MEAKYERNIGLEMTKFGPTFFTLRYFIHPKKAKNLLIIRKKISSLIWYKSVLTHAQNACYS